MKESDVNVVNYLGNVDYQENDKTEKLYDDFVKFLKKELTEKNDIQFTNVEDKGEVDFIKENNKYGFAFACSKFDESFKTYFGDEFKYKDDIVKKVLKQAIVKFEMEPIIKWDRGGGVFVFNVFI